MLDRSSQIAIMAETWYRCFHGFCNRVYFDRVSVICPERLPQSGPALCIGLHRNGAVDGFVYHQILSHAQFMISTQLRRNPLGRLFFDGIEVVRTKDEGETGANEAALKTCLDLLRTGGKLFVFPEGTSSLGPRHLPFKSGAVHLLNEYLRGGGKITVVPLGIHYECPWGFRSNVEVAVGESISVDLPASLSPVGRLKELKRRMRAGLESVGVNVESEARQETIQRLASIATLATPRSYFKTLKTLEASVPPKILDEWRKLEVEISISKLFTHQGVPLFPVGPVWLDACLLLLLGSLVMAAVLANLPPFFAAWWAGRTFPDDRNVISLWKILIGIPLFGLWVAVLAVVAAFVGGPMWFVLYAVLTVTGLKLYRRVGKLTVAVHNGLRHPDLRHLVLALRELVLQEIPE